MFQESGFTQPNSSHSFAAANDGREPIRHILIGTAPLVKRTIYQLHQARYAEAVRWTHPIEIPENRVILTPNPGEVMGFLVKLVRLE
ncbi:hypothetical protein [Almyronema epifaneia]|uniref:Uncharacterized protein n=1 Tax=Almyronema epifaneia S1 TaxID=2991925 RepID=A0ABW6I941_9CYAN